jgi:transposase
MKNTITHWIGMDVHADKIQISVFRGNELEPREEYETDADSRSMRRLLKKLSALPGKVRCIYEAGPCGYVLQRFLSSNGISCDVAAPSLIPQRAGDRVKTDRRDAKKLGRLYRSGELTTVAIPEENQEAVRDLVRAREDALEDVRRKRHRLEKFLLRHGYRYRDSRPWTLAHSKWLGGICFEDAFLKTVFDEYRISVEQAEDQLQRLSLAVAEVSTTVEYKKPTEFQMTLRGIQTLTAMTILSEFGDLRRFGSAREFMAAIGLVPSEFSSGAKTRRGSITKTGNAHVRRVLVEAAWHYRHKPVPGKAVKARRAGQPLEVLSIAQKADVRLHRKFRRMTDRGKRSTIAAVAVARELAGFVWAIGQKTHA